MFTPVARLVTRPDAALMDDITSTNRTPNLLMATLLRSGAPLLDSNKVYELRLNHITGIMELHEVGVSCIGKKWGHNYYDIPIYYGKECWLTKDELKEHSGKEYLQ